MGRLAFASWMLCAACVVGCSSRQPAAQSADNIDAFAMSVAGQIDRATAPEPLRQPLQGDAIDQLVRMVSSLKQQQTLHAQNIANAHTLGFKSRRSVQNDSASVRETLDFSQGPMENTGRQLDVAINGAGLFQVKLPDGSIAYTRCGNLFVSADHQLVLGNELGSPLIPTIVIPENTTDISIAEDGRIVAFVAGSSDAVTVGRLELVRFVNPNALDAVGPSMFKQSKASGVPIVSRPGEGGAGEIRQNFLENSNVDLTLERLHLVRVTRQLEMIDRLLARYEQNAPVAAASE